MLRHVLSHKQEIAEMSYESAREYLDKAGLADRIHLMGTSTATVALAAAALGCEEARIAKTLSFIAGDKIVIIVMAGDVKVDNRKYKDLFHSKAHMIPHDDTESLTGHIPGGVCPFGLKAGCNVYLDESLRRFDKVYPAAGTADSAVELTVAELEGALPDAIWIDVSKPMAQ